MRYTVVVKRPHRTLKNEQRSFTGPGGPVARHELLLPYGLDVWYGLYEQEYWEDDDDYDE